MKGALQSLYTNPKYAKVFEWGKLITITGGAQAIIQAIGLVSGILVIRLLPTEEYAFYTLANTVLGMMTLLSDGGISTGVMVEGGKVWQNPVKLGSVIITGFELRRKFALVSLFIVTPFLFYLLLHHGASRITSIFIILCLIPTFFTSMQGGLLQIVPRLHQKVAEMQENQVKSNTARIILTVASIFLFPFASVAIIAAGLPQLWANYDLKKITNKYIDIHQKENYEVQKKILLLVKKLLPVAIYYSFLGQITLWIISLTGTTAEVAQIGALGRIAIIVNIFNVIISTLIIPRYARLETDKKILLLRLMQILLILIVLGLIFVMIFFIFSSNVLSILGNSYSNLKLELMLSIIGSYLSLISGVVYSLSTNRGWILNPFVSISISTISILIGCIIFNVTLISGALMLNIFISTAHILMFTTFAVYKIKTLKLN